MRDGTNQSGLSATLRRNVVGFVCHSSGICIVILAVSTSLGFGGEPPVSPFRGWQLVDLTHSLDDKTPVYPGGIGFTLTNRERLENGFYINSFCMSEHCGTHIDAPSHKSARGRNIDDISLQGLTGPLVVVDVQEQVRRNSDFGINAETIRTFERTHGEIPKGAVVVANTGWARRWSDPKAYVNLGKDEVAHFARIHRRRSTLPLSGAQGPRDGN